MFYEKQPKAQQEEYKRMLAMVGRMSNLFSESDCPYLAYRAHENIFCKYFQAENLARADCSADAKKDGVGIGLKTWMGNDDQKVAEFGKTKKSYTDLKGMELVKKIAEYRNERIRVTMNMHGIREMIYHVVKRIPHSMQIMECAFDPIDIPNIVLIPERGNDNNTYFTDGRHTYHFSVSKNTLYMIFDDLELLDTVNVEIIDDPYGWLKDIVALNGIEPSLMSDIEYEMKVGDKSKKVTVTTLKKEPPAKEQLCLPLYSKKQGEKFVGEKSGLNQWNASGRKRDPDELYIPFQAVDRNRKTDFFPPRDTPFVLHLPDGTDISAKVCQDGGKAIMSNPNKVLGKWLLRDVLELPERTLITYEMLERFGIDSVVFTKIGDLEYSIDFAEIGTYESFYGETTETEEE